ncbi:hypothetical protein HS088_TW08G00131 [Tripterygium wilfordii]|uniref:Uncharacterized protein n=1 Tax=Tripterygium wilfordii TaxID=458696 RepID=A0A7J7DB12_TRIWF|nr:hypothetical protein HS088_TW08G00131 [Tripterygium wilfordii]
MTKLALCKTINRVSTYQHKQPTYSVSSALILSSPPLPISLYSLQNMRNQNSQLGTLIMLMLVLLLAHSASCRQIKLAAIGEPEKGSKTKHSFMFLQSLSAILKSGESSKSKVDSLYSVSRRVVPCGPNPLHH